MPSSYEWILVLALATGATLTVSVGLGPGTLSDDPEPEPEAVTLVEKADESISDTAIEGVRTETIERPNETERTTVSVAEDPPDQSRIEVLESIDRSDPFETVVINESTVWRYDEDEQLVVHDETDGYWLSDTQTFGMDIREMRETYEFEYAGVETINGRETHVIEMTPPEDEVVELSVDFQTRKDESHVSLASAGEETWVLAKETWWIDTETTYPIKQQITWTNKDGEKVARNTRTYEKLDVGVEHDEETFEFDPPDDAEVTEPNRPEPTRFDDHDEAQKAVPFELPEPELSEDFKLVSISVTDREDRIGANLLYYDGAESISIGVSNGEPITPETDIVERNVGDVDGTVVATDGRPFITWTCGDLSYRVHGPADTDRIVDTAESIGCH